MKLIRISENIVTLKLSIKLTSRSQLICGYRSTTKELSWMKVAIVNYSPIRSN
ncbi:MAG: hypothetical protein MK289_12080 [Trichodesmium sp. ALOHA_ZT_67]|uniref:hypothetical protein n=1 Tax=Trichodesmium erythraeum TaxID=1206 RepID=UPI0002DD1960|nr:hypothetical protein [Trichodesmium erythraeum GBRTRLIN201]MCH2049188.1 hypothetical protein [Trichodesmium sp. ALOHA_ZT_67]MDE5095744.1 hypothetical protein [Trichodesmium sp. St11_bin5]MDT9338823.1 hypothetical protein [Trichodesmium erythraeum 21-75]